MPSESSSRRSGRNTSRTNTTTYALQSEWFRGRIRSVSCGSQARLAGSGAVRSHLTEGRERPGRALEHGEWNRDATLARALTSAGNLAAWQGDLAGAKPALDEAIAAGNVRAGRRAGACAGWRSVGANSWMATTVAPAQVSVRSLALQQQSGNDRLVVRAQLALCVALVSQGDLAAAERSAAEALRLSRNARTTLGAPPRAPVPRRLRAHRGGLRRCGGSATSEAFGLRLISSDQSEIAVEAQGRCDGRRRTFTAGSSRAPSPEPPPPSSTFSESTCRESASGRLCSIRISVAPARSSALQKPTPPGRKGRLMRSEEAVRYALDSARD